MLIFSLSPLLHILLDAQRPLHIDAVMTRIDLTRRHLKSPPLKIPFNESIDVSKSPTISPSIEAQNVVPVAFFSRRILILQNQPRYLTTRRKLTSLMNVYT